MPRISNAVKAQIIVTVNILLQFLVAFGLGLSDSQNAAVVALVNAVLGLYVALTFRDSPKRLPENYVKMDDGSIEFAPED